MEYRNKSTSFLIEKLRDTYKKINRLSHIGNVINFDMETSAPELGMEGDSDDQNFVSAMIIKIEKSKDFVFLIDELHDRIEQLDPYMARLVELNFRDIQINNLFSSKELNLRNKIFNDSYSKWYQAKNSNDFSIFKDSLKDVINQEKILVNKMNKLYPNSSAYTKIFSNYEYGINELELDTLFDSLSNGIKKIISNIKSSSKKIRTDFLSRKVSISKQEEFSKILLSFNGFDFKRGSLSTTEHPFTSQFSKDDVRVTTHYFENNFLSNTYSVIHEGGHALFGQNLDQKVYDAYLEPSISMAKHESVSRFYENVIGRSKEYIHAIYPIFHKIFSPEMDDISEEDLYLGVNYIDFNNVIRTEADELTYSLHIIIRYKLEKMLLNDELKVDDLPKMWNQLYKEYLGVDVKDDKSGVLQDVHWTSGLGYFPTYALGNLFNCMYVEKMGKDFDYKKAIYNGEMNKINDWMKKNVYSCAPILDSHEFILKVTGKDISADAYLKYLNQKYKEIYEY